MNQRQHLVGLASVPQVPCGDGLGLATSIVAVRLGWQSPNWLLRTSTSWVPVGCRHPTAPCADRPTRYHPRPCDSERLLWTDAPGFDSDPHLGTRRDPPQNRAPE